LRGIVLWLGVILILVGAVGCTGEGGFSAEPDNRTLNVVATIFPLSDLIGELGGDRAAVSYLLPAGASPHTFEPTVEQTRLLTRADLFVYVGAGLDNWALQMAEAAGTALTILELAEQVELLSAERDPLGGETPGAEGREHDDEAVDPHIWLDPLLVRDQICPRIYEALVELAPEDAAYFTEKLDAYQEALTALDEKVAGTVAGFRKTSFISFHSAWGYFARRYGLHEAGVIAGFHGQEPSASQVAALAALIKEEQIGAIFAEPQFSTALAERLAAECGSEVLILDPLGGEALPGRDSYFDLMLYNLDIMERALQ